MSDIFLSYAREDLPRVKPVVDALKARGWSVWWDRTIKPGQTFDAVIEAALDTARCVVVLWSLDAVKSWWVRTEADEGQRRRVLIPALLDEVVIPLAFRRIQAANLVGWSGTLPHAGFDDLAQAVEDILAAPAREPPPPAKVETEQAALAAPSNVTITKVGSAAVRERPSPAAGETRQNPKDGLTYIWIPPGKFVMGCSPDDSEAFDYERPPHEVTVARGFWLGQTPVTQEAYQRVMGSNPSHFKGARLPVENVSWDDAQAYGKAVGMRLPTEAEWEYAARAGSTAARYGDLDQIAWYSGNSGIKTREVRKKLPNAFGLYDMLGNVWEWVADWYGAYAKDACEDPIGPSSGAGRVLRGGFWNNSPRYVRTSSRNRSVPSDRYNDVGFRCAGELR